ncbi:hypothetical protein HZC21_00755 [Candidatus Peregrinibacteria bacterium]|nr:hypothetical protein [Candidatus Peregrinibacteria bacterium]
MTDLKNNDYSINMNTIGDALKEIDAILQKTAPANFRAQSALLSLKATVRASVGLAQDPKRCATVDKAIMEQPLPAHIKQLISTRLLEVNCLCQS